MQAVADAMSTTEFLLIHASFLNCANHLEEKVRELRRESRRSDSDADRAQLLSNADCLQHAARDLRALVAEAGEAAGVQRRPEPAVRAPGERRRREKVPT